MTQMEIVKQRLREKGEVSRNWCLSQYISRLSGIIKSLNYKGWEFKGVIKNNDYVYVLIKDPAKLDPQVYDEKVVKQRQQAYHNPTLI